MTEAIENKKPKLEIDMKNFKTKQILINNAAKRTVFLLGEFAGSTEPAIVILEKVEFDEDSLTTDDEDKSILQHIELETIAVNDIYGNFFGIADSKFNKLKVSTIHPATQKHIEKYTGQEIFLIDETPKIYQQITLPYIENEQFSLDWVYNILEHKKESETIIYEDLDPKNGFILLPDLKWNGQKESLYIQAIVMDRTIKSIRDLNGTHLPLLENLKDKSLKAIKEKYNVEPSQIRTYFHYQPSFYHLHVHFTFLKYDAPGIFCEKSHLINTVINNIKMMPDYYQRATLTFARGEKDKLYQAIKNAQN